ncbi:uncharacterized protein LOC5513355 [Nematostella vectensis]|uniref:uncharacterized protein LOC5513355 n=1 Tax=Nematostella vectensis TaxID=45351 RepID=UPI0020773992|nr:uncharacterized protein LOC5513355 [Nematostella vectensis]
MCSAWCFLLVVLLAHTEARRLEKRAVRNIGDGRQAQNITVGCFYPIESNANLNGRRETRTCMRYVRGEDGICKNTVPPETLVYSAGRDEQLERETTLMTVTFRGPPVNNSNSRFIQRTVEIMNSYCFQLIRDIYCQHYFPLCDHTTDPPQRRGICKKTCEDMNSKCRGNWTNWMNEFNGVTWNAQARIGSEIDNTVLMDCSNLPEMVQPILHAWTPSETGVVSRSKHVKRDKKSKHRPVSPIKTKKRRTRRTGRKQSRRNKSRRPQGARNTGGNQ